MPTLIRATDVTLHDLETNFQLQLDETPEFFPEWRQGRMIVDELTESERKQLDRIRQGYLNLVKYPPILEDAVKMVVLSPLLYLAGYYLEPFHFQSEFSVRLASTPIDDNGSADDGMMVEGKIDFLILKEQFWFMVIESKRISYSIEAGLAQILAYMLANPQKQTHCYGLITTGGSFVFLKLVQNDTPRYSLSKSFETRDPDHEFYHVLAILKYLVGREGV